ncbi:unnamed protein product [Rhizoctonia solani]|uniref:Uncharacterized protein n=1 Tax=Rhizoctonia solani TaxID=456999 RepID=A0A8H3AGA1_9AGAM|nr:unnamed protein product [Rhizoctonia solani]
MKAPIRLDAYNRIDDEELNAMITKVPEGYIVTMTLDCFHGGRMYNINQEVPVSKYRGGTGRSIVKSEGAPSATSPQIYPNTFPSNLFVPPVFHLHSEFSFDPKATMERVQGPGPLKDAQATVFAWSRFSTSLDQAGVFTSAFTSVVQLSPPLFSISLCNALESTRW